MADVPVGAGAPENLTRCCDCGDPFPGPVENWDDYFTYAEEAAFACAACAKAEGYPSDD